MLTLLCSANYAEAGTYWVSPTGAATWVNCQSATPLAGAAACDRNTANANAVAGDTVYFRGGTYTVAGSGLDSEGIDPANSGTSPSNMITFSAYSDEVPIITGGPITWGIWLSTDSYIKIVGFTFQDIATWAYIIKSSSYNEIASSTFTSTAGNEAGGGITISGTLGCAGLNCWNTHNWIHNNTFSKRLTTACGEGANIFTIGQAYGAGNNENNDNYNTIENNTIAYSAHGGIENNSMYTVIRNNFFHNEPWISGCTNYQGGTSNTSLTISTANQTFIVADVGTLSLTVNAPIGIVYASDYSKAMSGLVQSYNAGTGELVVRNVKTTGSGTYSNWILSQKNVPYYTNASYNGMFGHRNIQLGDDYARDGTYVLLENNRIGHASNNPGNGGSTNLDLASPRNIVRFNDIFNGMASGIYFKYSNSAWWSGDECITSRVGNNGACGGFFNRVYNNTIYYNGHGDNWRIYGNMNNAYNGQGIAQWDLSGTGPTGNIVKNNIVYDNAEGDICQLSLYDTACSPETWDTLSNNWLTTDGDPKFTSIDLSDATSATLPNLSLQSNSTAIDGGTYLTQANGSGSNSTTLVVDDALYFQDGTWGSDLNRGINFFPDWIAVGNTSNIVQISSINYSTNTITLASAISWSDNDSVWLYKKSDGTRVLYGTAPEYGAHEYVPASVAPSILTSSPSSVSTSTLTLDASITSIGSATVSQKGFAYGTSANLSSVISTTTLGSQVGTGTFTNNISSLTPNTTYYFRAYAVNTAGTSTGSISSTTTLPWTVPGSPTSVSASAGNGQVVVTFTAPISNGGSSVLYYTASSSPHNIAGYGATSPITVTGLTNGTTYTFTVTATNLVGTSSASSASTSVTPAELTPTPTPTPTPAQSGSSSGSGTGGGGGGNTATIFATPAVVPSLATSTSICKTIVYPIITKNLLKGSNGSDVALLHKVLSLEKFFLVSSTSLIYDAQTVYAVSQFQKKYGIVSSGTPETTGFGNVGPKTRSYMNQLISQAKYPSLAQCLTVQPIITSVGTNISFVRTLKLGSTGADVKSLQVFLNNNGFVVSVSGIGSKGNESSYFGPATQKALIKFQEYYAKDILTPSGLTKGTGYFGPATLKKVNTLLGKSL